MITTGYTKQTQSKYIYAVIAKTGDVFDLPQASRYKHKILTTEANIAVQYKKCNEVKI